MSIQGYIGELRAAVGPRPLNLVGAAAPITDARGHVLLGRRAGGHTWGVPAGLSELGEALKDTLTREVHEECGLHVHAADLLDVISGPHAHHRLANGHEFYAYTALYRVTAWSGTLRPDGDEIADVAFHAPVALPALGGPVTRRAVEALA